jgi:signal peptidase I
VPVAAESRTPGRGRRVLIWAAIAALIVAGVAIAVHVWAVYPLRVASGSMSPTLRRGDWVVVHKLAGRDRRTIRRSQLVVFRFPFGSSDRAVKRVVALAGDSVEIGKRYVRVNGHTIATAGGPDVARAPGGRDRPLPLRERIPAAHVFLLGDNSAASIDSRSFGPAPDSELVGRVWFVVGQPAWWLIALIAAGAVAAVIAVVTVTRLVRQTDS